MKDDIETIIREMDEVDIARIRGGYEDPMFSKGDRIEYRDVEYCIVDYATWASGDPVYVVRPLNDPGVATRLGQDLVDMFATKIDVDE